MAIKDNDTVKIMLATALSINCDSDVAILNFLQSDYDEPKEHRHVIARIAVTPKFLEGTIEMLQEGLMRIEELPDEATQ